MPLSDDCFNFPIQCSKLQKHCLKVNPMACPKEDYPDWQNYWWKVSGLMEHTFRTVQNCAQHIKGQRIPLKLKVESGLTKRV